jgi:hypothetical protein
MLIDSLPLRETTCAECEEAFWRRLFPDLFKEPTRH